MELSLAVLRQMNGHRSQDGLQALGAGEVDGFSDPPDNRLDLPAAGTPARPATRPTGQVAARAADQGVAGQVGELFRPL